MLISLAVDAMGGDHGCRVTVPAALDFLALHPDVRLILVGQLDVLTAELKKHGASPSEQLRLQEASEIVTMDESPQHALKNKKNSSMRVAINLVKQGEAQACISAGNTGALMATARFVLKTLPGIERPAIAKIMPNAKGQTVVLDLGANIESEAAHLLQFGIMGAMLASAVLACDAPRVGLLNVGAEEIKGTNVIKEAAERLRASDLNFYGNVEGNDIFKGTTDVVVCDGFTGNVALKASEGVAKMFGDFLREEFTSSWWRKILALLAYPVLRSLRKRLDPRRYNGASLLGLNGTVVKSHGGADRLAFRYALDQARLEVEAGVIDQIRSKLAALQAASPPAVTPTPILDIPMTKEVA